MQHKRPDEATRRLQTEKWGRFTDFPFSQRALSCFENAEIHTVEQITEKTAQQMQKFRNVGRSVMMEIRLALARMNLSLKGEPVYSPPEPNKTDNLKERLSKLEQQRDEILVQIQQIKSELSALRPLRRKSPPNPQLAQQLFTRWKELKDYELVAQEFSVSSKKVRTAVQNEGL